MDAFHGDRDGGLGGISGHGAFLRERVQDGDPGRVALHTLAKIRVIGPRRNRPETPVARGLKRKRHRRNKFRHIVTIFTM